MIGIHKVHRRLAELTCKADRIGGYNHLTIIEQQELNHCLKVNSNLVIKLDELKSMSFIAHLASDQEWQQEICLKIDGLEAELA